MKNKKQERGAIIIEIIAVVALLGVMGPMLFKQVAARNDEVENINIATEIRTIKEGFSSYILAERNNILANCNDAGDCTVAENVENYLPIGFEGTLDHYELILKK